MMMLVIKIMRKMFRCHGPCLWLKKGLRFSRMERFFWLLEQLPGCLLGCSTFSGCNLVISTWRYSISIHPTYSTTVLHPKAGFCFYIFVFQTKDSSGDSNKGIREWFHGEFDPHPICYLLPLLKGNMCM